MYPPSNRISCIPVLPSRGPGRTAHTAHTARCLRWGRSLPRDARRQQVHVSPNQRLAAIKPRSSEPAGLCLCSQPYTHPKYQSKELEARRSLSLLPPKRSHNIMKACHQRNQQMSMQCHHVVQPPGLPAAKSSEPGATVSVSAQRRLGASQGLCLRLLQEMASTKTHTDSMASHQPAIMSATSTSPRRHSRRPPTAPNRTDRRLLPRRAAASARLARRLDPPSTNHPRVKGGDGFPTA